MGVDSEGNQVQSVHAHVTISERVITGANGHYPIRNGSGEINFKNHKVDVADSSGMRHYLVLDWFADEKLGGIVIRLQDFAG